MDTVEIHVISVMSDSWVSTYEHEHNSHHNKAGIKLFQ